MKDALATFDFLGLTRCTRDLNTIYLPCTVLYYTTKLTRPPRRTSKRAKGVPDSHRQQLAPTF